MADAAWVALGTAVLVVTFADALTTTLSVGSGGGFLTRRLTAVLWRALLKVHRRDRPSGLLSRGGSALLLLVVLVWVLGLWSGWTLVLLAAGEGAVVNSDTRVPAGTAETVYYAGFTVFTLGVGDFVATTPGLRVLTAFASFTGLFLVTLAITYLISVVSAVVGRRSIAVRVFALGDDPASIVVRGWTGEQFGSGFVQQLVALSGELATSAEQHLAYPVLHFYRSHHPGLSAARAVAVLDEALLLLGAGVAGSARPDAGAVETLRRVVRRHLEAVDAVGTRAALDVPPVPDLGPLARAGIPTVPQAQFAEVVRSSAGHRRELHRLVASDGWSWPG